MMESMCSLTSRALAIAGWSGQQNRFKIQATGIVDFHCSTTKLFIEVATPDGLGAPKEP